MEESSEFSFPQIRCFTESVMHFIEKQITISFGAAPKRDTALCHSIGLGIGKLPRNLSHYKTVRILTTYFCRWLFVSNKHRIKQTEGREPLNCKNYGNTCYSTFTK